MRERIALLAVGFLWVFELITGITTDQTLLEWADPTRPLLRRLSMEAPGTYAHTINVANLAEAAAAEVGANGLLCRVGVLYHDIGKMLKPHYFVENQPEGRNPHDKLKPEMSAAIVRVRARSACLPHRTSRCAARVSSSATETWSRSTDWISRSVRASVSDCWDRTVPVNPP